ncbi:hypothetical protein N8I77_011388 [Diaporthe amygdali]|uniref:Uncharacterized protein n=1 Tax=Phomopsis amygdali TaxID=1214568 RepID=A0AAD9S5B9_PHOAM|nr:hypothetical protein N8I77_011388 [Diaporthe amygdali]
MPASKRLSSSDSGDIWRREEYRIKKLYKKHSVKDLKRIMEKNGAFPERAVPTWIENLGKLDIRKNVTTEEWRKIYRRVVPRLENPARQKGDLKLKRTKKETEIIVRGRKYTWDQAWKNMKSAKAIGQLPQPEEALSPLPPDIVIRTPTLTSPPFLAVSRDNIRESSLSTIDPPANRPASGGRAIICRPIHNPTGDEAIPLVPSCQSEPGFNEMMEAKAEEVWRLCLAGLPIWAIIYYAVGIYCKYPQAVRNISTILPARFGFNLSVNQFASRPRCNRSCSFQ